jgi:hypothetical protein
VTEAQLLAVLDAAMWNGHLAGWRLRLAIFAAPLERDQVLPEPDAVLRAFVARGWVATDEPAGTTQFTEYGRALVAQLRLGRGA